MHEAGLSLSQIARETGLDGKAVRLTWSCCLIGLHARFRRAASWCPLMAGGGPRYWPVAGLLGVGTDGPCS
ncbi:hypothetical protein Nm8I071_23900 [Nonomuraea sp. TT08I-71]|nr:hypothetical protein Nm8I071_23900 [Nonomuraea sp. TT08I-71]